VLSQFLTPCRPLQHDRNDMSMLEIKGCEQSTSVMAYYDMGGLVFATLIFLGIQVNGQDIIVSSCLSPDECEGQSDGRDNGNLLSLLMSLIGDFKMQRQEITLLSLEEIVLTTRRMWK